MKMDVGRRRTPRYSHLPDNLEPDPKPNGRVYYRYRFPDGNRVPLGSDEEQAVAAARRLNDHFSGAEDLAQKALSRIHSPRPSRNNPSLPALIQEFREHYLERKRYADSTRKGIEIRLGQYERQWPKKTVRSFRTLDLSRFLNEQSIYQYVAHRSQLVDLFQFACHQGYRNDNPAKLTLEKSKTARDKKRQRHTLEGYKTIYDRAPEWLQRAMGLLLYTMQRREDIVLLEREQVNLQRNTITILQSKTRNYANPVYIEIEMGKALREVVEACLRSPVHCPTLVHRIPDRLPRKEKQKGHPFSVTPDYLSRAFAAVRDESGAYDHIPKQHRPTVHEIRALGSHLYEQAGYSQEYIMALGGWASERMLRHYQKDHVQAAPKLVRADLKGII